MSTKENPSTHSRRGDEQTQITNADYMLTDTWLKVNPIP